MNQRRASKPEGHQLVLVANRSRLLDTMVGGQWESKFLGPDAGLKSGAYHLTDAQRPAQTAATRCFEGSVLHVDVMNVYQVAFTEVGKPPVVVRHNRLLFREAPVVGSMMKVNYVKGAGQVVAA